MQARIKLDGVDLGILPFHSEVKFNPGEHIFVPRDGAKVEAVITKVTTHFADGIQDVECITAKHVAGGGHPDAPQ